MFLKIIQLIIFLFVSVPPTESTLHPSTDDPLSVGDFLNLTCSTDSSNPPAALQFRFTPTDFKLSDDVYSNGNYNGKKTTRSMSGSVWKSHHDTEVECSVNYNGEDMNHLKKTYTIAVPCKYH